MVLAIIAFAWLAGDVVCRQVKRPEPFASVGLAVELCAQPHKHTLLTKGAHLAYNLILL